MNVDPLCPQQHTNPKHDPNRCIFCEYGAAVRADALQAARDAVERASSFMQPLGPALAAIDALREENK